MLQSEPRVAGVFIHDVVPASTPEEIAKRQPYRDAGVFYFDTYVGAAVRAHAMGLISKAGLARVAAAARVTLAAVPFASAGQSKTLQELYQRDFAAVASVVDDGVATAATDAAAAAAPAA
jgi:hypothetical protein